ncbi:MAG: hypothetical protein ACRDP4_03825, partial [Nocardioidaceae bacterium]
AVSACSGDSDDSGGDSPAGESQQPVTVSITEQDGEIHASSTLVKAHTGQKITFRVSSDAADEIHVHSVPEDHEFEVKPADDQEFTFSVQTPGSVEVESHGLEVTILKLQVS